MKHSTGYKLISS